MFFPLAAVVDYLWDTLTEPGAVKGFVLLMALLYASFARKE